MTIQPSRRGLLARTGAAAAILVAACGPRTSGTGDVPKLSSGPVEVFFTLPASPGLEQDLYTGFITDFQSRTPRIKVNYNYEASWGDYPGKLKALLLAGTWPDIAHQHLSVVQDFAHGGFLTELKAFMAKDKLGERDFISVLIEEFTYRGKLMAIPKDSAAFGIYYNKDMYDKSGIKYPDLSLTWDDFARVARELTKPEEKRFGAPFIRPRPDSEQWEAVMRSFGGGYYDKEQTKSLLDKPENIDALQFFADLEHKHRVTPSAHQYAFTGDAWRGSVVAMTSGHHSTTFFQKAEKREFKFDVMPIPRGKGGRFVAVGASGYALPGKARYKAEGWELLKFLVASQVQCKIASGKRWGPNRPDCLDNLAPDDGIPANFRNVHVEPLKGKGAVPAMGFVFPVNQLEILRVWDEEIGQLWAGKKSAKDAALAAKPLIDQILARSR